MPPHMPLTAYHGDYYYFRPYNFAQVWQESEIVESWGLDRHYPSDNRVFQDLYKERVKPPKPITQFSQISSAGGAPIAREHAVSSQPWEDLSVMLPDSHPAPTAARQRPQLVNPATLGTAAKSLEPREVKDPAVSRIATSVEVRAFPGKLPAPSRAARTAAATFESPQGAKSTVQIKGEPSRSTISIPAQASVKRTVTQSQPVADSTGLPTASCPLVFRERGFPLRVERTDSKPALASPSNQMPGQTLTKFKQSGYVRSLQDVKTPAFRRHEDNSAETNSQAVTPAAR